SQEKQRGNNGYSSDENGVRAAQIGLHYRLAAREYNRPVTRQQRLHRGGGTLHVDEIDVDIFPVEIARLLRVPTSQKEPADRGIHDVHLVSGSGRSCSDHKDEQQERWPDCVQPFEDLIAEAMSGHSGTPLEAI